jgi:8-oxo-dGTP pyrophosphatase MutT (NUDIX family)
MRLVVAAVVVKDGKILLVQEAQKKVYGKWHFPAGYLDEGEYIFDAVKREAKEETGYDVKINNLLQIYSTADGQPQFMLFECEVVSGDINFDPEEILDVKWVPIADLHNYDLRMPREVFDNVLGRIKNREVFPIDVIRNLTRGTE